MENKGALGEIIDAIFKEMGRKYEISYCQYARCEILVDSGEVWAVFPHRYSKEREEIFLISDPIVRSEFKEGNLVLDWSSSEEELVEKLSYGKIRLAPLSEPVGWRLIEESYPDQVDNFATLDKPLVTPGKDQMYVMASKNYPKSSEILDEFNKALKVIKENGTMDKILSKYKYIYTK